MSGLRSTQTDVADATRAAADRLSATSDTARLDAELLMAHALGVTRSDLLLRHMRDPAPQGFAPLVERRAAHEPVAHIVGRQEFYGLDLAVTSDTLIPRGDSEALIDAAQDIFAGRGAPSRILDLGTGSGALLLAGLSVWAGAEGIATDRSEAALAVAQGNATALGFNQRARFLVRDWHAGGWARDLGKFDLILCNPPYVEADAKLAPSVHDFEPATALYAGAQGLDDYRVLLPQIRDLLAQGGVAIFEIGASQGDSVRRLAEEQGFSVDIRADLAGRDRAVICT